MADGLLRQMWDGFLTPDPYAANNKENWWRHKQVEIECDTQALRWFFCSYRISALLRRVDDEGFAKAWMLDEGAPAAALRDFVKQKLKPLLSSQQFILMFDWPKTDQKHHCLVTPHVYWYARNDDGTYSYDPNAIRLKQALNAGPAQVINGCEFTITLVKQFVEPYQMEQNFRMLSDKSVEKAVSDPRYAIACQEAAVVAMQHRMDVLQQFANLQDEQTHGNDMFSLRVTRQYSSVAFEWKLKGSFHSTQRTMLIAYRTAVGFEDKSLIEATPRIVEARADGHAVDRPGVGLTYYYTFGVVRENAWSKEWSAYGLVRFSIHIPSNDEIRNEILCIRGALSDLSQWGGDSARLRQEIRAKVMEKIGTRKALEEVYEEELERIQKIKDEDTRDLEKEVLDQVVDAMRTQEQD